MRVLVFTLALANLLFLVWTRGHLGATNGGEIGRVEQQVHPEKLVVVARGQPPSVNAASAAVAAKPQEAPIKEQKVDPACQLWSELPNADADRVEELLTEKFSTVKVVRQALTENNGYWVFIPPSANRDEVDVKIAELQQLGVQDYFVVQAAGPNRFAISLGTYRSEEAAQTGLSGLRRKGVKNAQLGERLGKSTLSNLSISGPAASVEEARQAIVNLLPKAAVQACPTNGKGSAQ
ncbi:MAG TPA: SPOR domain-containing protein [Accumulibacter sp.]|nr:SPOR domain-containing protein [Accumulibacter sp.]